MTSCLPSLQVDSVMCFITPVQACTTVFSWVVFGDISQELLSHFQTCFSIGGHLFTYFYYVNYVTMVNIQNSAEVITGFLCLFLLELETEPGPHICWTNTTELCPYPQPLKFNLLINGCVCGDLAHAVSVWVSVVRSPVHGF